ncbi:MAG: NepR family anti-sigma factor [Pseudomonadota bacterium]
MPHTHSHDDTEDQIDQNLRKVYQKTLNEQVPDKLLSLLDQLREQDGSDDR